MALIALLQDQLLVLRRLKELAQDQRSLLATGQPSDLWRNLNRMDAEWRQLERLEGRQVASVARACAALGLYRESVGLRDLMAALPTADGSSLGELVVSLSELVQELSRLNAQNAALVQSLLHLTGQRLRFYTMLYQGYQPYNASGQKSIGHPAYVPDGRWA